MGTTHRHHVPYGPAGAIGFARASDARAGARSARVAGDALLRSRNERRREAGGTTDGEPAAGEKRPPRGHGMSGSIGRVETQRVVLFTEDDPLVLDSGATLAPVEVAYETYGELNADRTNAVFVCHALTGDAHAAGHHGDPERPGWWDNLIGPGKPLDTDRVLRHLREPARRLPRHDRPDVDRPGHRPAVRPALPAASPWPTSCACTARCCATSASSGCSAAIGGSLGGMQVLQWALDHPDDLHAGVVVCASARLSAQNIAFSAVARTAILRDEHFHGGDYYETGRRPDVGLAVARMMAHITYLSEQAMREKFGRRLQHGDDAELRLRHRLPGRELPRPPGPQLPRALRRELVPVPDARHGLLRPVRRPPARRWSGCAGAARASWCSRSTPTGASTRSTRATSCASSSGPTCRSRSARSRRRTGTTRSCCRCPSTTAPCAPSCGGSRRRPCGGAAPCRRRASGPRSPPTSPMRPDLDLIAAHGARAARGCSTSAAATARCWST